ncbi:MAG: putative toxin-antitoxin system toxin component, PIN family [Methanobacteriota archaeon]
MLRLALDANVVLSGLFFDGNEDELLVDGLAGRYRLVLSGEIMEEVEDVVARKFRGSPRAPDAIRVLEDVVWASEFHRGPYPGLKRANAVVRDADDAVHVAFVLAARPDAFVTGDKDLLVLKRMGRTRVIRTKEALAMVERD